MWDWIGFFLVTAAGAFGVTVAARMFQLPPHAVRLLWMAFFGRVVGALLRYEVLEWAYSGVGDARSYYLIGLSYAEAIRSLDFSIFNESEWWANRLWGTQFLRYLSGFALVFLGPSMRGEFLLFSLGGLFGLGLMVQTVRRESEEAAWRYAPWVALLPSLCFWPSSVGKESVMLLGLGILTYGYGGRAPRVHFPLLGLGLLIVFMVRPYAAAMVVVALVIAELFRGEWSFGKAVRSTVLLGMATIVCAEAADKYDLDPFDMESVDQFIGDVSQMTSQGGSQIEASGSGLARIPLGLVNVLFRPFLWEAGGVLAAISALELTFLWGAVWLRRRELREGFRDWNERRTLRFGLVFAFLLAAAYGLSFFNLGIIARQRSLVWPFLLTLFAMAPRPSTWNEGRALPWQTGVR